MGVFMSRGGSWQLPAWPAKLKSQMKQNAYEKEPLGFRV